MWQPAEGGEAISAAEAGLRGTRAPATAARRRARSERRAARHRQPTRPGRGRRGAEAADGAPAAETADADDEAPAEDGRRPKAAPTGTRPPRRRRPTASESTVGPVRTCIGCRRAAAVEELVRFRAVRTPSAPRAGARGGTGAGRVALPDRPGCVPRRGAAPADGRAGTAHPIRNDEIERLRARLFACDSSGDQQVSDP